MTKLEALVQITQIMMQVWKHGQNIGVGQIASDVARCSEVMQYWNKDERIETENKAIIELAKRYNLG